STVARIAAATMLYRVKKMSPLKRPLARMAASEATISLGGIIVTRLMIPSRQSNSSAANTTTMNAARAAPTFVTCGRHIAVQPCPADRRRSERLLQIFRQELLVDHGLPVDRAVRLADQLQAV